MSDVETIGYCFLLLCPFDSMKDFCSAAGVIPITKLPAFLSPPCHGGPPLVHNSFRLSQMLTHLRSWAPVSFTMWIIFRGRLCVFVPWI